MPTPSGSLQAPSHHSLLEVVTFPQGTHISKLRTILPRLTLFIENCAREIRTLAKVSTKHMPPGRDRQRTQAQNPTIEWQRLD